MDFEERVKKRLLQDDFAKNNGRIIRTINILSGKFIDLDSVEDVLSEYMKVGEFEEGIIYLHKSCYIEIRTKHTHKIVDDFNKYSFKELEVTLTQKGIKLARGFMEDDAVEV